MAMRTFDASLLRGALGTALVLGGCASHRALQAAPRDEPLTVTRPRVDDTRGAPPAPPCAGRRPCEIDLRQDAGSTADGRPMTVVELSLGMRSESGEGDGARDCREREVWLVQEGADAPPPRLLLTLCNDGYGASGVGEDEIQVSPGRLTHLRLGGSAWRWSHTTTVSLDPLTVLETTHASWWSLSTSHSASSRLELRTLQGQDVEQSPPCGPDGEVPDPLPEDAPSIASQPIIATALPARLTTGPIDEAAAIDISGCGTRGAAPDADGDAAYAVVIDPATKTALIQLRDDAFDARDALTLWATSAAQAGGPFCWRSQRVEGLVVAPDGRVLSGAGAYPGAQVEVGRGGDDRRLVRVRFETLPVVASLSYRDADPSQIPTAIATSDAEAHRGERVYLGRVRPIDEKQATCELDGDRLVPRPAAPDDTAPFLGDGW